jgi:hypothetical protein
MGKATELDNYLMQHPRDPEELKPKHPELRLRPDAELAEGNGASVDDAVERLRSEHVRSIGVLGHHGEYEAVIVPVDRYLELTAAHLQLPGRFQGVPGGRFEPSGLAESDVELADPNASWAP